MAVLQMPARRANTFDSFMASRSKLEHQPEEPKHSSTQVNLPKDVAKFITNYGRQIPESMLAEDGRETEPHITVLYGLPEKQDVAEVAQSLGGEGPIKVKFGKTSVFDVKGKYDVLKIDIESSDIHRLNGKVAALPHTSTHPQYVPHATIAYLKSGEGKKWSGKVVPGVTGKTITIDVVKFSPPRTDIPLKSPAPPTRG